MAAITQWALDGAFSLNHTRYETQKVYPSHIHKGFEIYCFLCGEVEYHIENSRYRLHEGDVLIIGEGAVHRAVVAPGAPYERITIHFTREFLAGFDETPYDLLQCFCVQPHGGTQISAAQARESGLAKLLQALAALDTCRVPQKGILVKLALVRFLLAAGALCERGGHESCPCDERISGVAQYLCAHLCEPLNLDALASRFFLSKYHLCHKFKQETGMTLTDYLQCKRIHHAHCLLQAGTPATLTAHICGFSDYSHFYRLFKKRLGLAPSAVPALFAANASDRFPTG